MLPEAPGGEGAASIDDSQRAADDGDGQLTNGKRAADNLRPVEPLRAC